MWTARDVLVPLLMVPLILFCGIVTLEHWPDQWWQSPGEDVPGPSASYELYDCVPLSDFGQDASVSGSASVVTIGGKEYVRMESLGDFTVSSGGSSRTFTVSPAELDLVLLTGQSNSVYYTSPSYLEGEPSPVAPGKAFYIGTPDPASEDLAGLATLSDFSDAGIVDLVSDDGTCRVAQMYPAFCSSYVEETGHRVLVVNSGIGGKGISSWDLNGQCDLWTETILSRAKEIQDSGSMSLTPSAVLWSQGESDVSRTESYYVAHLVPFLGRLADGHYSGYEFPHVLSVLPRYPGYTADSMTAPALAQIAVSEEDPSFEIASSLAYRFGPEMIRDSVHYTQEAYGWLGEAFGRAAALSFGVAPVDETIVICEAIGAVQELPETATCYGTSGASFELSVDWSATETGYEGTLSGNPEGTVVREGLTAEAALEPEE